DGRDAERRGEHRVLRAARARPDDRIEEAVAQAAGADLVRLAVAAASRRRRIAVVVGRAAAERLGAAEGVERAAVADAVVGRVGVGGVGRADGVVALVRCRRQAAAPAGAVGALRGGRALHPGVRAADAALGAAGDAGRTIRVAVAGLGRVVGARVAWAIL